jgi:hypothetical protein
MQKGLSSMEAAAIAAVIAVLVGGIIGIWALVALLRMSHWTVKASQAYLAQVEQGKAEAAPAPYARV